MSKTPMELNAVPPLLIMGVAGSGKTTCGRRLSEILGIKFIDADDFHSSDNIVRMSQGIPLGDKQRWPWLERIVEALLIHRKGEGPILACSALKEMYRNYLRAAVPQLKIIYLRAEPYLVERRIRNRLVSAISPLLIDSQFTDLEIPEDAIEIDASIDVELATLQILRELNLKPNKCWQRPPT
ncbi:MAG: gluconokinase, GntK/IdnK-type [Pseudomonadota bacterium]|nr:gluconokinase, GntK/IdnK-type [Pseudomonadota bacterium]